MEKNLGKLSQEDQKLVIRVRDSRFENDNAALSMWDFADAVLGACGGSPKNRISSGKSQNPNLIISSFVERVERHKEQKDRKVESAKMRKQESELSECTFQPALDSKKLESTHARYMAPRPARAPYVAKSSGDVDEVFAESLRDHGVIPRRVVREESQLGLTPAVKARLEEAVAFYEVHREQMREIRFAMKTDQLVQ